MLPLRLILRHMSVKIRLQRHGKKGYPFYHIVVADSRAPRDGRFIERLGLYNPNTNPATVEINVDKAVTWLNNGAQPTDTARAILSYKGVLYRRHLDIGVKKGAMTPEQADAKFVQWLEQKAAQIDAKKNKLSTEKSKIKNARLAEETKIATARAEAVARKLQEAAQAAAAAAAEESADNAESPAAEGEASAEA